MHIIALETEPSSLLGGQELNLYEICQHLAKQNHQITLVYLREGNLVEKYQEFAENIIQIRRYSASRKRIPELLTFLLDGVGDIKKISTRSDSIVFCNDFSSVFFGHVLASLSKTSLVQHIQLPAYPFKLKWRPGMDRVDRFIAVSQATKESWVKLGVSADKISVVYNGTDVEKFAPAPDYQATRQALSLHKDIAIISFAARLNPAKGLEVLLKAFAAATQAGMKAHLLVIGTPQLDVIEDSPEARIKYQESLKQLIETLKIHELVAFLGRRTDLPLLFQASDVVVVPSVWDEPFPRVGIEALACGTPLLASRIGGLPELLMPNFSEWLFEAGNDRQLAQLLLETHDWRHSRPALSEQCRQHILDHFSRDKMMRNIEQVLLDTIEART